jgi:hypothetical protein
MIFNTVNLDELTCIQKFDVPLEVANMTKKKKSNKIQIWMWNSLEPGFYCSNTVEVL